MFIITNWNSDNVIPCVTFTYQPTAWPNIWTIQYVDLPFPTNVFNAHVAHLIEKKNRKNLQIEPIYIEYDVLLGANSVILAGVTIHSSAEIRAGSVV